MLRNRFGEDILVACVAFLGAFQYLLLASIQLQFLATMATSRNSSDSMKSTWRWWD
ncbi:uncharacterized protein BDV17DRAFT_255438 [Aspergillus undulatus]|uniref:uncharacterized protein n=1 Tax=Aspergillus undulatus TaxID=1810928 RepID=UPI003CCD986E